MPKPVAALVVPVTVDALEMIPAVAPAKPELSDAEVLFPALPELGEQNEYAAITNTARVKARLRATALLTLRSQGHNTREIGRMLGMTPHAVQMALWRARKAGRLNDLRHILENDSAALAIDSLNFHLKKKDKDATFKTLEGLGHFKNYNHNAGTGGPVFQMPALTVTVVNAPNQGGQQLLSAPIGQPREDKAD
jgi:DNA-binding CsgD family transcriptional regulator